MNSLDEILEEIVFTSSGSESNNMVIKGVAHSLADKGNHIITTPLNGHPLNRLPNTLNVSFLGYNGHEILERLDGVAASTGSACHSGETAISPVLSAMGVLEAVGRGAVRFSLGRHTTRAEIDEVVLKLENILQKDLEEPK